ncbi:LITAF domain-containing protein-like [Glandiceps talaboti]
MSYPSQAPPGYTEAPGIPQPTYTAPPPSTYATNNTTVIAPPPPPPVTFIGAQRYRDSPVHQKCPNCKQDIVTRTELSIGLLVWLAVGILFIMGLWLFCCLIPLCIPALKDVTHHCPNCNTYLGKYDRLS